MVQFTRIFLALALTVSCLSCSSWALSVPATTSATTCSSQLRELATQLDDAFSRVFDDVTEIATSIFSPTATPPTGGTSTLPVASNPTTSSSGPTPRTLPTPGFVAYRFRPLAPTRRLDRRSPTATSQRRTLRSLYQNLTRARGEAPSDAVYDHFVSAMSDVSREHFKACYGPSSERVRPTHVQSLIRQFNGLRNTTRVHELRAVFAKLLCVRDHNSRIGKRSTRDAEDFFRGLNSTDFGDIFGFTETNRPVPTGSLAFAVDTTGSMWDEIQKVQEIIRSFVRSEKQEPFYYVLAEFNDYDRGRPASRQCDLERGGRLATAYSSRDPTDLNNLVTAVDSLRAHGGGDCHEYGMAGILKCLHTRIHPSIPVDALGRGSHIVVLTDAGSKDRRECMDQAIAEARAKVIPVHFFLSSTGCLSPSTAATYKQVAEETGGVVVENTLDFEALTMFIHRLTELQRRADSGPYRNRGRGKRSISPSLEQRCHTFRASAFTTSLDLLFNTTSTHITVRKPDNHVVTLTKRNTAEKLKYFSQKDPQPGAWTACVSSPGTLSVSTAMPTDVKFIVSFLKEGRDAAGNTKYYLASRVPYACSMGTVVVRVLEGQITNISTSHPLYLDFLDADKNVLQEISVTACNGLFRGEATFPASTDFLQLRGTDVYGVPFSYIRPAIDAPVIFRPSRFSLTSTSGVVSISTGSTHTLTYQLQAVETEGSTSFNFSLQTSTSGFDTNVSPAQAVISANQSVTVSVQVTPTSHVAAGNHQITLAATSGCDTLSAVQSVTINTLTAPTPASDECGGCQNGGTCFSIPWGTRVIRRCGCTPGYAGTYCEIAF